MVLNGQMKQSLRGLWSWCSVKWSSYLRKYGLWTEKRVFFSMKTPNKRQISICLFQQLRWVCPRTFNLSAYSMDEMKMFWINHHIKILMEVNFNDSETDVSHSKTHRKCLCRHKLRVSDQKQCKFCNQCHCSRCCEVRITEVVARAAITHYLASILTRNVIPVNL